MADLAFGISMTAVQLLADKVNSALREEPQQWQNVQRDLVFIRGEFEMMQSFLNTANAARVNNHVVRTWVRQVRDLSYDMEDSIEFVLHLDTNNKRSWWLRLLSSFSCGTEGAAQPVDEAVNEIKQLKARVEDVSQRKIRYKFIGDSVSKSLTPQQLVSSSTIGGPGLDILVEARDTAARCRSAVDLTKLVTEKNDDLRVISVWGTGDDLGTMSIIRNMYDDPRIYKNFRCRAWVKVMHPINPPEIIRSLVVQFYANCCQEQGALPWLCRLKLKKKRDALSWTDTSAGDLVQEFVQQVNTHRYLIILEDLSTVVQWDAIRPYLRDMHNGSRIVVSTRHHEIASLCTGKPYRVSELQRLSANQSTCAFFNAGFENAESGLKVGIVPKAESHLVGRESEIEKLFNLVMDRSSTDIPHVVSVWGIPGSGRTAVVTNVYDRCCRMPHFHWCWTVNMSQPYNLKGFCRCLVNDFYSGSPHDQNVNQQAENAIEQCRNLLHEKRLLIVIDEVLSKEHWDMIKSANLISAKSKSCIVVITIEESIAIHCAGADNLVCSIKCLQATAAFDLFQQVFHQEKNSKNDAVWNQEEEYQSNEMVQEVYDFIFNEEEQIFQYNENLMEEQAFQSNDNLIEGHALQSNESSLAFQNNGMLFQEQPFQNYQSSFEEQAFQHDAISLEDQAFQNKGNSFEEQVLQYNGIFLKEILQDNGNSFEQTVQNKRSLLEASQNSRNSFEEQVFQNSENSIEEQAFQNSENSFEEQAFKNSETSFEEQPFETSGNLHQVLLVQDHENSLEEETYSLSPDDPNVEAILSRTGGIPQVIDALGRYLANQHMSRELWCQHLIANFMQELQTNPQFDCLRGLLAWMNSYFWSCPPSQMRCMLYLLIFPRGQTFRRRRLVRRWIAEGYTLDDSVGEHFNKLASQSVMRQVTTSTMEARYEVNGFFHEYMISRPMEDKFFFPVEVSVLEENNCRVTTEGVGQHLAIWNSWDRNRIVFDSLDFLRLRSLTVFGRCENFFISDKMRVLRVLDLEDACDVTQEHFEQIGKVLLRLKFLSLRGCTQINHVPDSLGGLRQLQTLDIKRTSIAALPLSITKLNEKLQYVRASITVSLNDDSSTQPQQAEASCTAEPSLSTPSTSGPRAATLDSQFQWLESSSSGTCLYQRLPSRHNGGVVVPTAVVASRGVVVPRGIGQMVALHTLGVIDVSAAKGRRILKEVKNLSQLRKLAVSGVNRENCQELCSAISCQAHLESLSVFFDKGMNRPGFLDAISPTSEKLRSLKLYGHVSIKLPIKLMKNLSKLKLQINKIDQDEVKVLGDLQKLETLCLHFLQGGKLDYCKGFDALRLLEIGCNSNLETVTFRDGAMHNLEVLNLRCHNKPCSNLFSGLELLPKLKEVSLSGWYDNTLKQQLQSQLDGHPKEMKPVLKSEH